MVPRLLLDTAPIPGGGELRLYQRGDEFSIMLGANELMNSRLSGSEEQLAELALARIGNTKRPRILIGGLGMGFTLRAALAAAGHGAEIIVAELIPAVIAWARGPMAHLHGDSLTDARVTVVEADVADLMDERYDAILLDVDNGPDGLTNAANDRLYSATGLNRAQAALRPGGVLAIWSSAANPKFTQRLAKAGFAVDEIPVRARGDKGAHHIIWIATARR